MVKKFIDILEAILDLIADKVLPFVFILSIAGIVLLIASLGLGFALPIALSFKALVKFLLIGRYGKPLIVAVKEDIVGLLGHI